MNNKVIATIEKFNMISGGEKIIVALSGGGDSVSLLHILLSLKDRYSLDIEAAHVNHCIRGEDADADEAFVSALCEKLGVRLNVLRADVPAYAKENGMTVEEAGRKIRYDYFRSLAGEDGLVATAHNLNDRIETFLFNYTRGATLKGLCSIPAVRDGIIRPLLNCSKDEILAYCENNGLDYVTDITNSDTAYSRNRIRHNVITELKKINPGMEKSAARCMDSLIEDERFLSSLADKTVASSLGKNGYDIDVLAASPAPVRRRAIAQIIKKEIGGDIDMISITETDKIILKYAAEGVGKSVQLQDGRFARTRAGKLEFPDISSKSVDEEIVLKEGFNRFGNYMIAVSVVAAADYNSQNVSKDFSVYFGDYDRICGDVIARNRNPGDVIRPSKRGVSKQIRKIQNERKIPPEIRDSIPVICDDKGILCAYGCGIDARFAVSDKTERIIIIRLEECAE
ncbi:MAG: tRNA lysidine(34) synthetase TilS [Clostridia bacterium]|nr:tRNA lysidine(34) synthetase TilS [Clostridia bacterium]